MNGFDLKEMTSWKKENDMCVYVDNSVDLVDFLKNQPKKMTKGFSYPHARFVQVLILVLGWSMKKPGGKPARNSRQKETKSKNKKQKKKAGTKSKNREQEQRAETKKQNKEPE